jgi:hypothetical protein
MKVAHIVMFAAGGVLSASASFAQLTCSAVQKSLSVHDAGGTQATINASTWRNMDPCPFEVQTEAWFSSTYSPTWRIRSVLHAALNENLTHSCGSIRGNSKHWLIKFGIDWEFVGADQKDAMKPCGGGEDGPIDDGPCPCTSCACSPILVDLGRNGYHLTSASRGVLFDLDGDGKVEQVAWTQPGSDDAWLALDRNGNGVIDDGKELFGDRTPAYVEGGPTAVNGFEALSFTEGPDYGQSYADRTIDLRDSVWKGLLFWRDANHNGFSEPEELTPVSETPVTAFSTEYQRSGHRDRHGNEFRLKGRAFVGKQPLNIYDVWLTAQ